MRADKNGTQMQITFFQAFGPFLSKKDSGI